MAAANETAIRFVVSQILEKLNVTTPDLSLYVEPYHDDLLQLHKVYTGLPEFWLLVGHSCFCSSLFSKSPIRMYWLISFWISVFAAFGGGTLAGLVMQDTPIWLREDHIILTFAACWWAVLYSPLGIGSRIFNFLPVKMSCKVASNILRARVIITRVDIVMRRFGSGSIVAPVVLGTLSGCGGRLISDVASLVFNLLTPSELAKPSWSLRSAFSVAFVYVLTAYWFPILPHDAVKAVLVTYLVAQGLASDLTGLPLDVTSPFATIFHTLTGIPVPPSEVVGSASKKMAVKSSDDKKSSTSAPQTLAEVDSVVKSAAQQIQLKKKKK